MITIDRGPDPQATTLVCQGFERSPGQGPVFAQINQQTVGLVPGQVAGQSFRNQAGRAGGRKKDENMLLHGKEAR